MTKNPQHPRAASLALVALNERVHTELPSGWPGEIAAPPAVWDALEHGFDAWVRANAHHPLRDLRLLPKLRVVFLRGDAKRAWDVLLGLYPRHPLRIVWEMRHLLLADMRPTHIDVTQKLRARVALRRCDFVHASEAAVKLGPDSVRYTLEVLADEPALRSLAARTDALGARAMHALALRALGDAQWQAAADVWQASHTAEAERWREAAKLAADTSYAGRTKLGAWLLGRGGAAIFPDSERAYSRGLKARLDVLDDASQPKPEVCASLRKRDRLADALLYGGRRERALLLYADALRASDVDPKSARRTLSAADALYNQLLNWDASGSASYPKLLAASPAGAALREAGKRLRAGAR